MLERGETVTVTTIKAYYALAEVVSCSSQNLTLSYKKLDKDGNAQLKQDIIPRREVQSIRRVYQ